MNKTERSGYRNGRLIYPISVLVTKPQSGGGGGSCQPGPNTVGTEEIIDGSVKLEDLNQEVVDRMTEVYDENTGTLYANGARPPQQ